MGKSWRSYVSAVGGQVGGTLRKGAIGVRAALQPGLGFKYAAEHGQGLHIVELRVVSQPGKGKGQTV